MENRSQISPSCSGLCVSALRSVIQTVRETIGKLTCLKHQAKKFLRSLLPGVYKVVQFAPFPVRHLHRMSPPARKNLDALGRI